MPTIQSAKVVAENALSTIGAFPASQSRPDPGEMKKALRWLEMLLNYESGIRPLAGFWQVIEIPLEAGVGDYDLMDYATEAGVNHVFSASIVSPNGDVDPIDLEYESVAVEENLTATGRPTRATATKDTDMVLRVFPCPTASEENLGLVMRVRIQTYQEAIDDTGTADVNIRMRPAWYLWLTKRLSYEIGLGPVRRLGEGELKRLQDDAATMEGQLLARDGQSSGPRVPVTEPMAMSVDGCAGMVARGYHRRGDR